MNNRDIERFKTFLSSLVSGGFPKSQWFYAHEFEVYLRYHPSTFTTTGETLVISNILVFNKYLNTGVFRNFVRHIEETQRGNFQTLKVENVVNHMLDDVLIRWGFSPVSGMEHGCISYEKRIPCK